MLVLFLNYITPQYVPPPSFLVTALMTPSTEISKNELNLHKFMPSLTVRLFYPFYPLKDIRDAGATTLFFDRCTFASLNAPH